MELTLERANEIMAANGGDLDLHGTDVTELPEGLEIAGDPYLSCTPIDRLPNDLAVNGSLDLRNTWITRLPKNLTVGCILNIGRMDIDVLPESLRIGQGLSQNGNPVHVPERNKLRDGDYVENRYLYADCVLTHVKKKKVLNECVAYIGRIPVKNIVYDVKNYVACASLHDGIPDLNDKPMRGRMTATHKAINPPARRAGSRRRPLPESYVRLLPGRRRTARPEPYGHHPT